MKKNNFWLSLWQTWQVIKPYWLSGSSRWAWLILLLVLALTSIGAAFEVTLAQISGEIVNTLTEHNRERFIKQGLFYLAGQLLALAMSNTSTYLRSYLQNRWRKWLSQEYIERYLTDRGYYKIQNKQNKIDNPDQRIQEDIDSLTNDSLNILNTLLGSISGLLAASIAIEKISPGLLLGILLYALVSTLISYGLFGKILKELSFLQLKKEADFRFSLIRLGNYAESIAFYQGEAQEKQQIDQRLDRAIENEKKVVLWKYGYQPSFQDLADRLPFFITMLVLAPRVFSKDLKIGILQQSRENVFTLYQSFSAGFNQVINLTSIAASGERLYSLRDYLKFSDEIPYQGHRTLDIKRNGGFKIKQLTLETPDHKRTLIKDLSLSLAEHDSLLILGESGAGKSSLLRVLAGLWQTGTGSLQLPQHGCCFFLPQKPYLLGGSLLQELSYPYKNQSLSDEQIKDVLERVKLEELYEHIDQNLGQILSLGEQQRLSFARLFLAEPDYVFLDEATSALDEQMEDYLYSQLIKSKITLISVGHRPNLLKYHNQILHLNSDQSWKLETC